MSDIRKYIELVNEWTGQPAPFGRKNASREPTNPAHKAELAKCRQFASAEAYATANNRFGKVNSYDPENIKMNAEAEQRRLMAHWNHWNLLGLLTPHQH